MVDLMNISQQKEKISQSVLQALIDEKTDTWNLEHLFDIAAVSITAGAMAT